MDARLWNLIDPSDTLLVVDLVPIRTQIWDGLTRKKMSIKVGETVCGQCDMITQTPPWGNKVHFDGIELHEDKRRRGIGLAAYLTAIGLAHERFLPFELQDATQTKDTVRIWKTLWAAGIAEQIHEFQPSADVPGKFMGKYRVPVVGNEYYDITG